MKTLITLFAGFVLSFTAFADSPSPATQPATAPAAAVVLREIRYDGKLSDDEARFVPAHGRDAGRASRRLEDGRA